MLFVHGFPEFWYSWRHQLVEFGEDYRYDEIIAGDFNVPSECVRSKKRLLGMTSIFVFFCNKVLYLTDHDFILRFKKKLSPFL